MFAWLIEPPEIKGSMHGSETFKLNLNCACMELCGQFTLVVPGAGCHEAHGRVVNEFGDSVVACVDGQMPEITDLVKMIEFKRPQMIEGEIQKS